MPEHGVVGTGDAAQQVEHRERDRRHDAEQHVEHQHRDGGGEGEHELAGAEPPEAHQLAYVDQPGGGVHDDRREPCHRERRQHRPQGEQREERADDGDQAAELGALPDGVADGGAAAAAADRDAAAEPGAEVGAAEGEQLALRVDGLAVARGERAAGEDVVGVGDEGDADRRADQRDEVVGRDVGKPGYGQPGRDVADDGDPAVLEVEDEDDRRRAEHADQGRGRPGEEMAQREQHGQRGQAERRGRPVQLVEVPEDLAQLVDERRRVLLDAEQLAELRGGHDGGDAGEVADSTGRESRSASAPEPEDPADQAARRRPSGPAPPRAATRSSPAASERAECRRPSSAPSSTPGRPRAAGRSPGRRTRSSRRPPPRALPRAGRRPPRRTPSPAGSGTPSR